MYGPLSSFWPIVTIILAVVVFIQQRKIHQLSGEEQSHHN
jgi:hypothetical protein